MSVKTLPRAKRPTIKAWVSKPEAEIDLQSLNDLQKAFGNRLQILRGTHGEVIIASQPQDKLRLDRIMDSSDLFSKQVVYV